MKVLFIIVAVLISFLLFSVYLNYQILQNAQVTPQEPTQQKKEKVEQSFIQQVEYKQSDKRKEILSNDWRQDLQKFRDEESTVDFLLKYLENRKFNKNIKSGIIKFKNKEIEVLYCKKRFQLEKQETCGDIELKLFMYNYIKPNYKVIEGGTYIGLITLRIAQLLDEKQGGRIYAFEANKMIATLLNESIYANKVEKRVELHNLALYNKTKLMHIYGFKRSYASTLTNLAQARKNLSKITFNTDKQKNAPQYEVYAIKLDDFFPQEILPEVNLIKFDLEHSDIPAIVGSKNLLSRSKNVAIIIELMGITYQMFTKQYIDECFQWLLDQGFKIWRMHIKNQQDKNQFCQMISYEQETFQLPEWSRWLYEIDPQQIYMKTQEHPRPLDLLITREHTFNAFFNKF